MTYIFSDPSEKSKLPVQAVMVQDLSVSVAKRNACSKSMEKMGFPPDALRLPLFPYSLPSAMGTSANSKTIDTLLQNKWAIIELYLRKTHLVVNLSQCNKYYLGSLENTL